MKLLIVTQVVDTEDPILGFFVRWVEEFAKHAEHVEVICLKSGRCNLPENVRVHSLGKERGAAGRVTYAWRFLSLAWRLRDDYDTVFVHMNQEYVLIAGWLWKLLGKRVSMWRNHYAGSWITDVAAAFCAKVFCTSKDSYTARYEKTVLMPIGIDTDRFKFDEHVARKPRSILFLARMARSKRPEMLVEALALLAKSGTEFTATFVGSPAPLDGAYYEGLKEKVHELKLDGGVTFVAGVPNSATPDLYRAHEIFVNASPSGMFDKTLFEAAACGCSVLAASADFAELAGEDTHFDSATELAERLEDALANPSIRPLASLVEANSLAVLGARVTAALVARPNPRRLRELVWRVLHALARVLPHQPRMTVLFYHSVSDTADFFAVPPDTFDRQMRYLRSHFEIVPLSRAFAHAAGERVERDSVAVTVDDGYQDFVTEALPVLMRYRIPSTVFVIGGTPSAGELGNEHQLLAERDARAFLGTLVSVGSHTLTHKKLTKIPQEEALQEMEGSRAAILKRFGTQPQYLSYPKGSYNEKVMQGAVAAGYAGAVTVVERGVKVGDSPFAIPRVQVDSSVSFPLFKAKLSLAADWYYKMWKLVH